VSPAAQDLITKLLCKDKAQRLGRIDDVREVISHPWFASIDTERLLKKELQPPYVPSLKDMDDTSNFDEKF